MRVAFVTQAHMTDLLDTNQRKLIENLCIDRLEKDFPSMAGAELRKGLETVYRIKTGARTAEKGAHTEETGDHTAEKGVRTEETGDLTTETQENIQRH